MTEQEGQQHHSITTTTTGGRFACAATRVFDGERVFTDHAVLVDNGTVVAVMPRASLPESVPLLVEPNVTILPGLIDTHVHFMRWQGPLFLANGVTTVRDTGNDLAWILARRGEWQGNIWPRILCTGPLLDGDKPYHVHVSRSSADAAGAAAAVRETAAAGVDGIKLYVGLPVEWLPAMTEAGHAAGFKVSMHCSGGGVLAAGRAGVDEFFHLDGLLGDIWPNHPIGWLNIWGRPEFAATWDRQHEAADAIRSLDMTATPTLAYWDSQWRTRTSGHSASDYMRGVPPEIVTWQGTQAIDTAASDEWRRALEAAQRFVGLLAERGVPLLAGSDAPCGALPPGMSLWRELALFTEAGLSPLQALRSATYSAATFLGQARLGRLSPGCMADIVVVRGDPLTHIPASPDIALVIRQGVLYRPADLLATAEQATATLGEEPWGRQFALHHARSVAGGKARDKAHNAENE